MNFRPVKCRNWDTMARRDAGEGGRVDLTGKLDHSGNNS